MEKPRPRISTPGTAISIVSMVRNDSINVLKTITNLAPYEDQAWQLLHQDSEMQSINAGYVIYSPTTSLPGRIPWFCNCTLGHGCIDCNLCSPIMIGTRWLLPKPTPLRLYQENCVLLRMVRRLASEDWNVNGRNALTDHFYIHQSLSKTFSAYLQSFLLIPF